MIGEAGQVLQEAVDLVAHLINFGDRQEQLLQILAAAVAVAAAATVAVAVLFPRNMSAGSRKQEKRMMQFFCSFKIS